MKELYNYYHGQGKKKSHNQPPRRQGKRNTTTDPVGAVVDLTKTAMVLSFAGSLATSLKP